MTINIVCILFAVLSFLFAVKCYRELRKWAHQCQYARIAISYKGKVKLHAPLTEWIAWINLLDKDKESNGRVIYRSGGTAVAITKKVVPPGKLRTIVRHRRAEKAPQAAVKEGTWSAKDQTPAENRVTI